MSGFAAAQPAAPAPKALTLNDYVRRVVACNQGLLARQLQAEISEWKVRAEGGAFEPDFVASAERKRTERENTIEQTISQSSNPVFIERGQSYSSGIEGLTPLGTRYQLGYTVDRTENNLVTWTRPVPFEGEYRSFAGLTLTQPLLRNAGPAANLAKLRMASCEKDIEREGLRKELMALVARAESAYWDLVLAQQTQTICDESVATAEKILTDNRERVAAGKMPDVEVLQAEAAIASRRSQQQDARNRRVAAVDQLRTFFSETATAGATGIVATDTPVDRELSPDFDQATRNALVQHPDYLLQKRVIEEEGIRVMYAKNQRWPELDLVGSYGLNGLGETIPQSSDDIGRSDYASWSVGLKLRIPLGGGMRARSELAAARLRERQALLDLKTVEIAITNALHTAIYKLENSREQLKNCRTVVEFNEKLLANEMARLDAGKSDSRKVLDIEEDLRNARGAEWEKQIDHQRAMLELQLAGGTVLSSRNLEPTNGAPIFSAPAVQ
ncbi:MAG: hypothetical protein A3K19_28875 [Lentisphaerae bacterium RIFOXYB12_FULL_65_16]|nr:MAG: hypothetical protein A3K18_25460 [Lentisphaerae bacterium RIFOXYA12_64_32]OGV88308.1 MAG: hypothetical protein A3K19_28875 [Lentisphaerae bacterium RIFOXYB12_FULL_65_16]